MDSRLQLQIGIDEDIQRLPSGFRSRSVRLRAENGDGQPFNRDLWQIDASVFKGGKQEHARRPRVISDFLEYEIGSVCRWPRWRNPP